MRALQAEGLSQRQACALVRCARRTVQYRSRKVDDAQLRQRVRHHAERRLRFGWRRLRILLKREGLRPNHKRLRRIYREERLQVRPRKKRRVRLVRGNVAPAPMALNEEWGLDFMEDRLLTRRKVRLLTIEDRFSREGLALDPDFSLTSRRVIRTLDQIAAVRGYPKRLRIDNGPENTAGAMLDWSVEHDVICTSSIPVNPRRTFDRIVQRPSTRRVSERPSILELARPARSGRSMASRLQRFDRTSWLSHAAGVRPVASNQPNPTITSGLTNGLRPVRRQERTVHDCEAASGCAGVCRCRRTGRGCAGRSTDRAIPGADRDGAGALGSVRRSSGTVEKVPGGVAVRFRARPTISFPQSTYSGTNTPVVGLRTVDGQPTAVSEYSHTFGYPNIWLNIGLTQNSQITFVLPSFAQLDDSATNTLVAGSPDVQLRYKNLFYVDLKHGVLGGVLLTYQAPTGSPGLGAPGPSYEINPLLNIALNRSRTTGLSLAFPVTNAATTAPAGGAQRAWSFSPQAVPFWRSPGGTLLALVVQYQTPLNTTALTMNSAQLLSRNLQLQGTFGASSFGIDYPSPTEGIGRTERDRVFALVYDRAELILIGNSGAPSR